jgi:hypothetical protein
MINNFNVGIATIKSLETSGPKTKEMEKITFFYEKDRFPHMKDLTKWVKDNFAKGIKSNSICKKVAVYEQGFSNPHRTVANKINKEEGMEVTNTVIIVHSYY